MHSQGPQAWFDDGAEERDLILAMGEPWADMDVLEIGCGSGELAAMIAVAGARMVDGIDYSPIAVEKAISCPRVSLMTSSWQDWPARPYDVVVMQGVLEHFDDPFGDLQAIIDKFRPQAVITSSPCFLNPRGIVWHTLDMIGAVMSKTDLHYLDPWQFEDFCRPKLYELYMKTCDSSWGFGEKMASDLLKRIPLALRDGGIPVDNQAIEGLINWLVRCGDMMPGSSMTGATAVYRIYT
jgi:SAM-dependent methyltransferase